MLTTLRVSSLLCLLFATPMIHAADKDFPAAPPNLKEAEAKGLQRLTAEELKTLFPGAMKIKRHRCSVATKTFKPDGSVEVEGFKDLSGTWRLDEKRGVYCDRIHMKLKRGERCYAVFRAGDGIHYFDYDIDDKLQTLVWRRLAE